MSAAASDRPAARVRLANLAVAALAAIAVWAISLTPAGRLADAKLFDLFTTLVAPRATALPVVILAVDEPSFQELQLQWPFPRSLHAQLLQRLRADGAAAVAFDVVFAEPSRAEDDAAFAQAIAAGPPVVLASSREMLASANATLWTQVQPLPALLAAGAVAGDIGVQPDADYVVRRRPAMPDAMAQVLAQAVRGNHGETAPRGDLIEYLGPRGTIDTRSYYQAVTPGLLPPGFFRGKIVLVGRSVRSAAELRGPQPDTFNSPFVIGAASDSAFPGVEIQATLLANRLAAGGVQSLSPAWTMGLLLIVAALLGAQGAAEHPLRALALAAGCAAAVVAVSWWLFDLRHVWLSPAVPLAGTGAAYAATGVLGYLAVRRRGLRVRGLFSQYVPPEVVAQLVERPQLVHLRGETREVTVMFTDLAGFTAMSEQLNAEQTVDVLTAYFDAMTPVIHRWNGTIDKYIGDAIMAFWGAPLDDRAHAEHAVRAAIEMQAAMEPLQRSLQARGLPPITMRIGLHTGAAVVGNLGSALRFSYTAVGDTVNLAARLEGANKAFGTTILMSQRTAERIPADLQVRALDTIVVKGKSAPVTVFTPCGEPRIREHSAAALAALRERRWTDCEVQLRAILQVWPRDPTALRLLQRVQEARSGAAGSGWSPALVLDKL